MNVKQKVLLIVLDGLGAAPASEGNAVVMANPEKLSALWNIYPHTYLLASGEAVGLPKNVRGNSEVGHLNLGAGNTVMQTLPRINRAIEKGLLNSNNTLTEAVIHARRYGSKIHLVGLLSDGSVHSHIDHFKAIIDFLSKTNLENEVYIHAMTDGRDSSPQAALTYLLEIDKHCIERGIGKIGTIIGRYYGMDRNNKWDRTQEAYFLLQNNTGERFKTYQEAISLYYQQNLTDEFLPATVINDSKIEKSDVVIFLNFRPDRSLQLSRALVDEKFVNFQRSKIENLFFASMVEYARGFPNKVLFPKQYLNLPLGKVIDSFSLRQLRIAESEKFPHVTYFFDGGTSTIYNNEDRIMIPSPNVATYDLKPEMSAPELTDILIKRVSAKMYDFILVNYANPDMVGHTGNLAAGIKAVSTVNSLVHELVQNFISTGGAVIITADHGNAEEMINLETKTMDTEHSLNPVPCIIAGADITQKALPYGALKDIAPTVLDLMGITKPAEMNGQSLIRKI
ncbi:MAG: 2,3-bisphosphoglycerate-independent phosphoglycerate mutase [candidate division WS6 bacterium GW2011_GWF1_35_23]|uniref:2,3-bisphosphoglycerate-independent phosphoglycerate mutase n=1 Tax=candidate division WS6 bacterium GW2011_GWF1_35_23 TaxID=1619097 RepID=A0A0G0CP34_9BACT|nr:MAG: 2,3-bisphosphoglycerate-independent phosphoglycerate mutase [candidate division WS6 bacterium GW2011_GWF1_35_23]